MKVYVLIPAAGLGRRMGASLNKQYLTLADRPVLAHTLALFDGHPRVAGIFVISPRDEVSFCRREVVERYGFAKVLDLVAGGAERQDSVRNGLRACVAEAGDIVLIHDGVRPLCPPACIDAVIDSASRIGACVVGVPVKDTIKEVEGGLIRGTPPRQRLWQAQTPQAARTSLLRQAYAVLDNREVTDEAALLEQAGIAVTLIEGSETNIKITRPDDLILAEKIMQTDSTPTMRIGHGYDAHCLVTGRKLVLAGVTVPHELGLAGHSDADVVTHALCDAVLGALGIGDIGRHFPDSEQRFKDIYSILLLEQVMELVAGRGLAVSNADITIICQAPKLAPHIDTMRQILARACRVKAEQINLKATTTEKMGFTGREEGISCHAVVLLTRK
jgi:2-C-methyl-D-erythritol 4-phosphate cytidylyltransferase/2-C-methyl-D-erythritol 2,4-cyclodiphosphate synthase